MQCKNGDHSLQPLCILAKWKMNNLAFQLTVPKTLSGCIFVWKQQKETKELKNVETDYILKREFIVHFATICFSTKKKETRIQLHCYFSGVIMKFLNYQRMNWIVSEKEVVNLLYKTSKHLINFTFSCQDQIFLYQFT